MNLTNRYVEAEYSRQGVKLFRYRYTAFRVIHWYGVKEIYHGKARYWWYVSPRAAVEKWLKLLNYWKPQNTHIPCFHPIWSEGKWGETC